ncbi:MAG: DUF86 domain-containing protein [Clostridiales bacterium]|nr:DUF86 domain-containing protein [Clostridiales bacterium]MCF8023732.1 DUF86 domain-containing protein [Clostridiales bacterium]
MKFNPDIIQKILTEYLEACRRLKELGHLSYQELSNDPHKIASAKYHFIIAIEAAIDICNHIIAKNSLRVPEDYVDSFKIMVENGLIAEDFSSQLSHMARFRNRLVHRYWDIDTEQLHNILANNLDDLDRFLYEIRTNLK